jgi:hypothetical protein
LVEPTSLLRDLGKEKAETSRTLKLEVGKISTAISSTVTTGNTRKIEQLRKITVQKRMEKYEENSGNVAGNGTDRKTVLHRKTTSEAASPGKVFKESIRQPLKVWSPMLSGRKPKIVEKANLINSNIGHGKPFTFQTKPVDCFEIGENGRHSDGPTRVQERDGQDNPGTVIGTAKFIKENSQQQAQVDLASISNL